MTDGAKKNEVNIPFAKMQRANDAKQAAAEYETAAAALRAKTERLKALRLARDATSPPPTKVKSARRKKGKSSTGSLADWLDGEAKAGRRG
jgi:hypothetical protein